MSENQIVNSNGSCQQNNIEKVENAVVEPTNFNNYHNSVVINLTLNVTGDISDAEISRIIKTATASLSIELKEIMRTNFDGEGQTEKPTFQLKGDAKAMRELLTHVNQKTNLEIKSTFCFTSFSYHFRRDNLTLSQVLSLCGQISKMEKS